MYLTYLLSLLHFGVLVEIYRKVFLKTRKKHEKCLVTICHDLSVIVLPDDLCFNSVRFSLLTGHIYKSKDSQTIFFA